MVFIQRILLRNHRREREVEWPRVNRNHSDIRPNSSGCWRWLKIQAAVNDIIVNAEEECSTFCPTFCSYIAWITSMTRQVWLNGANLENLLNMSPQSTDFFGGDSKMFCENDIKYWQNKNSIWKSNKTFGGICQELQILQYVLSFFSLTPL